MKIFLPLVVLIAFQSATWAQNLVPNNSFENPGSGTLPCSWINNASEFVAAVSNWSMPTSGSTDIFSTSVATSCYAHPMSTNASRIGQQMPRTGNNQAAILTYGAGCGFNPNYREYLQVLLTSALTTGQDYDFEFWISLADESRYASNNFGIRFNTGFTFVNTCYVINQTPQFNYPFAVTSKFAWIPISGTITATAAWRYIIIGNFYSNAATSALNVGGTLDNTRYFIDDISVSPVILLPAAELSFVGERKGDGIISLHWEHPEELQTKAFEVQRSGDGNAWNTVAELETVDQQRLFGWDDNFPPAGDILYRVRYTDQDGENYTSNVVQFSGEDIFPYRLQIASHPVASNQPVRLRIGQADDAPASISIMDMSGRTVWSREGFSVNELDGFEIPAGTFQPNLYVISMSTARGNLSRKLVIQ